MSRSYRQISLTASTRQLSLTDVTGGRPGGSELLRGAGLSLRWYLKMRACNRPLLLRGGGLADASRPGALMPVKERG
jgi:hypothetical protein